MDLTWLLTGRCWRQQLLLTVWNRSLGGALLKKRPMRCRWPLQWRRRVLLKGAEKLGQQAEREHASSVGGEILEAAFDESTADSFIRRGQTEESLQLLFSLFENCFSLGDVRAAILARCSCCSSCCCCCQIWWAFTVECRVCCVCLCSFARLALVLGGAFSY